MHILPRVMTIQNLKTIFFHFQTLSLNQGINLHCMKYLNPLSANPTKWPNTLKQFVGNSVGNLLIYMLWGLDMSIKKNLKIINNNVLSWNLNRKFLQSKLWPTYYYSANNIVMNKKYFTLFGGMQGSKSTRHNLGIKGCVQY